MSELDNITQQLERVTSNIDSAKSATDHAYGVADEKMHIMAGLGLDGVAEQMRIAGESFSAASSELDVAHTSGEAAASAMRGVLDGTRLSDTINALGKVDESLSACGTTIDTASSNVDAALSIAQDAEVDAVANNAMVAVDAIGQAAQSNEATKKTAADYRSKIEARGGGGGTNTSRNTTASQVRPTGQSQVQRPRGVPPTWSHRHADSGKGHVWQSQGAKGNTDMVRVMDSTQRYPHGYVRFYNAHGQPIGLDGKPGPRAHTHIPVAADGTHQTPQGWKHD